MAARKRWQWDKQGDGDFHANLNSGPSALPVGVTLSAPTAELHQETKDGTWVDRTSEVTITATVVNAQDSSGADESGGTNRGIRVVITADPDPQPDVADEPEPDKNYRVKLIATRSDSSRPFADAVDLTILP